MTSPIHAGERDASDGLVRPQNAPKNGVVALPGAGSGAGAAARSENRRPSANMHTRSQYDDGEHRS